MLSGMWCDLNNQLPDNLIAGRGRSRLGVKSVNKYVPLSETQYAHCVEKDDQLIRQIAFTLAREISTILNYVNAPGPVFFLFLEADLYLAGHFHLPLSLSRLSQFPNAFPLLSLPRSSFLLAPFIKRGHNEHYPLAPLSGSERVRPFHSARPNQSKLGQGAQT